MPIYFPLALYSKKPQGGERSPSHSFLRFPKIYCARCETSGRRLAPGFAGRGIRFTLTPPPKRAGRSRHTQRKRSRRRHPPAIFPPPSFCERPFCSSLASAVCRRWKELLPPSECGQSVLSGAPAADYRQVCHQLDGSSRPGEKIRQWSDGFLNDNRDECCDLSVLVNQRLVETRLEEPEPQPQPQQQEQPTARTKPLLCIPCAGSGCSSGRCWTSKSWTWRKDATRPNTT